MTAIDNIREELPGNTNLGQNKGELTYPVRQNAYRNKSFLQPRYGADGGHSSNVNAALSTATKTTVTLILSCMLEIAHRHGRLPAFFATRAKKAASAVLRTIAFSNIFLKYYYKGSKLAL